MDNSSSDTSEAQCDESKKKVKRYKKFIDATYKLHETTSRTRKNWEAFEYHKNDESFSSTDHHGKMNNIIKLKFVCPL